MKLGDFFKAGPHARPVNPKPISFTCVSREKILPGGTANPHGRPVLAKVDGCLIFIGDDGVQQARIDARKHVADKAMEAKVALSEDDFELELTYQLLFRVLHEWDEKERRVGERLFVDVDECRSLVEVREANRLFRAWDAYIAEEHPEGGVDDATFRGAEGGGAKVARKESR